MTLDRSFDKTYNATYEDVIAIVSNNSDIQE